MAKITKAALAAELGISRQRIGQYVDRGMPILADGKLDREAAITWIKRNVDPTTSSTGYFAAASSRTKARGAPPIPPGFDIFEKIKNPADAMLVMGLLLILHRVGSLASIAAHGAGADRPVAERTGEVFTCLFAQAATDLLAENGVEPIASNPDSMIWPHPRNFDTVAWNKLGPPGEFARKVKKSTEKEVQI